MAAGLAAAEGTGLLFGVSLPPEILLALEVVIGYTLAIDKAGGDKGVDITGVVGTTGCIVTPHEYSAYPWMVKGATLVIDAGKTIADFVIKMASAIPSIGATLCSSAVLEGFIIGGPVGAAVGALVKGLFSRNEPEDPLNRTGGVVCDQQTAGGWSTFTMLSVGREKSDTDKIALLSWNGFFSAQPKGEVFANRHVALGWETWTLERHTEDGTVSLKSFHGPYLGIDPNRRWNGCRVDQPIPGGPGGWGRFFLENVGQGQIALRSAAVPSKQYLTVVPKREPEV